MTRKSWFHAFCLLLCVIIQGHVSKGKNLYVSRVLGNDGWSCDQKKPCKTIWRAVTLASRGDHIYLDGTNTENDPYTCQSETSPHSGIYINKSLSLIGFGPMPPLVRCTKGKKLTFDGSDDAQRMEIILSRLFLNESFVYFQDSSVNIDSCRFEGSSRGVRFLISTRMVSNIQITNSTFIGNEECILVRSVKNLSPQRSQIIFSLKNSSFHGNTISDKRGCLSFSESPNNTQSVSCNITLENVTFSQNKFSSRGLVFLELAKGNQNINLQEVTFVNNSPLSDQDVLTGGSSEFFLRSTIANIFFNASNFTGQNARLFDVNAANVSLQIYNSSFGGHKVKGNGGVILLRGTDLCKLNITNSSFINTSASQGGAINMECYNLARVSVQESNFTSNAASGSGGAVCINVSAPGSTNLDDTISEIVELNYTRQSGQLLHWNTTKLGFNDVYSVSGRALNFAALKASVQARHSTLTDCVSSEDGRVFPRRDSLSGSKPDINLLLLIENVRFVGCSGLVGGSLTVVSRGKIRVSINKSLFLSNFADSLGGALHVFQFSCGEVENWRMASQLTIERSKFINNSAFNGGAIYLEVNNKSTLTLEQVIMESNSARAFGGAATINPILTIKILSSRFLTNSAEAIGGVFNMIAASILEVVDSFFDSNYVPDQWGGALLIQTNLNFKSVLIINTTFTNCSAASGGGAVFLEHGGNLSLVIKQSRFRRNRSFKYPGIGGALYISLALDGNDDPGCIKEPFSSSSHCDVAHNHPSYNYKSYVDIEDTTFEENAARFGGAVLLNNGKATIQNCHFVDNFATLQGCHIYTAAGSASLIIQDSFFLQTKKELHVDIMKYSQSSFVHTESSGALNISNTTMDARPYSSGNPLVKVENGRLVDVGRDNLTEFYCPVGSEMEVIHFTEQFTTQFNNTPCKIEVTGLQLSCSTCTGNSYSLQRGHALGSLKFPGFQCLPCPFGANCSQNIFAKHNFWGFQEKNSPPTVRFTMCPVGYCIPPTETNFPKYNGCQGNRFGELCGNCSNGYTETLYSTHCRPSHQCNDYWFWPVALAYVSLMALYFTFKPPVVPWIKRQILWFKANKLEEQGNNFDKGYLKILFYFYQAANLLLVSKYLQYPRNGNPIEQIVGVFNFKVHSSRLNCPFPGLTLVTKQLFSASHVLGILLMICAFYILHREIQRIRGQSVPSAGPYIGGVLQTLLLGYTTLATASFSLLRCVPIGSERRLFYDGNIVCFQWWQYIFIAFVCTFVVPFVFVLLWGSFKFYGGILSVGKFLLACFVPLPSLIYWLFVWLSRVIGYSVNGHSSSCQVSKDSVERVLYDSFKRPVDGSKLSLSWESIMIGRRLILVMIKTFVSDPLPRLLVMNLFCVMFLLHHVLAQPFRDSIANIIETISLLSIVVLATGNAFFASFLSLAVNEDHFSSSLKFLNGVEIAILCFVPFIFGLFVVAAILSQLCRLAFVVCRVVSNVCSRRFRSCHSIENDEGNPLLVPVS